MIKLSEGFIKSELKGPIKNSTGQSFVLTPLSNKAVAIYNSEPQLITPILHNSGLL